MVCLAKEVLLYGLLIGVASQMPVCQFCHHSSAWCAFDETFHDEERLIYLFEGACVLADSGGDGSDAHRTTPEFVDDGAEYFVVDLVEAILVDIECCECYFGDADIDVAIAFHLSEVAHASEECVGDTWCATASACDF